MIRLNLAREPQWLDLGHGVEVLAEPLTSAVMMQARRAMLTLPPTEPGSEGEIAPKVTAQTIDLIKAVGRLAIRDWRGVAAVGGEPAPVTSTHVDALLDLYPIAEAFERLYLGPALTLAAEKNVFAPLPNGTSAGAIPTAPLVPGAVPAAHTT